MKYKPKQRVIYVGFDTNVGGVGRFYVASGEIARVFNIDGLFTVDIDVNSNGGFWANGITESQIFETEESAFEEMVKLNQNRS